MVSNARSQKKQHEILRVARELFMERGYDAVSLDDILERVGGSKATLYSYYGGKEGLFVKSVQSACHEKLAPLLAMDVTDLDPREALNAIGRQFLQIISKPDGRSMFRIVISESQRFPQLALGFYASGPQTTIQLLRRNFEHWQRRGLLHKGNAEVLATQFLGMIMGTFHTKSLLGIMKPLSERQIRTWVARGVDLFLEGAARRPH